MEVFLSQTHKHQCEPCPRFQLSTPQFSHFRYWFNHSEFSKMRKLGSRIMKGHVYFRRESQCFEMRPFLSRPLSVATPTTASPLSMSTIAKPTHSDWAIYSTNVYYGRTLRSFIPAQYYTRPWLEYFVV